MFNKLNPPLSRAQRVMLVVVPPFAVALIRLLCGTLRFKTAAAATAEPADEVPGQHLYTFWHDTLLLAAYRYRDLGIHILISQSFDGELIARIVQRLGFVPVRGSSSRGGVAGLLALTSALRNGGKCAITVDGPRGPRHVVKPGAAAVALRAQAASLSPFHLHPSRSWRLASWDRFVIPKPFASVLCTWPTPVPTRQEQPKGAPTERSIQAITDAVQQTLDHATTSE